MSRTTVILGALFLAPGILFFLTGCGAGGDAGTVSESATAEKSEAGPSAAPATAAGGGALKPQQTCPVMGGQISKDVFVDYKGQRVYFCCAGCEDQFNANPEKYLAKLKDLGERTEPVQ